MRSRLGAIDQARPTPRQARIHWTGLAAVERMTSHRWEMYVWTLLVRSPFVRFSRMEFLLWEQIPMNGPRSALIDRLYDAWKQGKPTGTRFRWC